MSASIKISFPHGGSAQWGLVCLREKVIFKGTCCSHQRGFRKKAFSNQDLGSCADARIVVVEPKAVVITRSILQLRVQFASRIQPQSTFDQTISRHCLRLSLLEGETAASNQALLTVQSLLIARHSSSRVTPLCAHSRAHLSTHNLYNNYAGIGGARCLNGIFGVERTHSSARTSWSASL